MPDAAEAAPTPPEGGGATPPLEGPRRFQTAPPAAPSPGGLPVMGKSAVAGVVHDLEGWAARFLDAARAGDALRAEEAVAGLVDWLGHDLVDAFLFMDLPTWEALSALAEDLFQALRGAQAALGGAAGAAAGSRVLAAEAAIGGILQKARAIREAGDSRCR